VYLTVRPRLGTAEKLWLDSVCRKIPKAKNRAAGPRDRSYVRLFLAKARRAGDRVRRGQVSGMPIEKGGQEHHSSIF
jgi:hypothetical protein